MKKIAKNILLAIITLFPFSVLASGGIYVSPSSINVEVGSTKVITITATNTIGDVSINSNNSGVASISTGEWGTGRVEEGKTKSGTVTVTGVREGSTTISFYIDAATFDGDDLAGQTRTVTVNVVPKSTPTPTPYPSGGGTSNNTNTANNANTNINTENNDSNKSTNNNLKEIKVDGYNLTKIDNNNYTLSVSNDVTSINVNAISEDDKSKITGNGKQDLNVGENNIELIITSESGSENKINIKVTRKDGYYLDDLDTLLNNKDDINIIIKTDTKLSSQDLTEIKNSKKVVKLNYFDDNKKLIYSWILDGAKINDFDELLTTIKFESNNSKKIYEVSNYADGLYINLSNKGVIPKGTKIKLFVENKYKDGSNLYVYHYNNIDSKLNKVSKTLKVKDGYIEFDVNDSLDYFITMSKIDNVNNKSNSHNPTVKVLFIIIIFMSILLVLVSSIIIYILKRNKIRNVS